MLEDLSLQNSHVASMDDNEIYINVVGGGNKKGNVYGLGVLSKRFNSSTSAHSARSQASVVHQIWDYSKAKCWTCGKRCQGADTRRKDWAIDEKSWTTKWTHAQKTKADTTHLTTHLMNNPMSGPSDPTTLSVELYNKFDTFNLFIIICVV